MSRIQTRPYRYVTADVFTDRMVLGNPVAVLLDATGLSTSQMQAIACEFGYTETKFVLAPQDPAHTAQVRIFTPSREVPFAGHPNIGTAFVLAREAAATGDGVENVVQVGRGPAGVDQRPSHGIGYFSAFISRPSKWRPSSSSVTRWGSSTASCILARITLSRYPCSLRRSCQSRMASRMTSLFDE